MVTIGGKNIRELIARTAVILLMMGGLARAETKRPNVVFVLADQWRACAAGYAGDPNVKTPNIDRLEKESVDFTHAVSACPVCTPCRASLLTGQRATTNGIFLNDAHLPDDATTLSKVLAAAGYDTGIIGKWHLSGGGRSSFIPREERQGFEYWKVMECMHAYNHSFYYADTPEKLAWDGYDAIAQTKDAQAYVTDHAKKDKPFFLCLWWGPPHNPYDAAPQRFKDMYDPRKLQLRANVPAVYADAARKALVGYYGHCSALDQCMGDLWQTLKDAGVDQNTILIFSADHGDMLFSNGYELKQKPWDESLRVPMLWHWPAQFGTDGKKLDVPISSEDFMPTLLALCGAPIPRSVEGIDYSGHMKGGANPNPDDAALINCVAPFSQFSRLAGGKEFRGVRTPRYTYVRDLKGPWLLYDDQQDPYQMKNLVNTAEARDLQNQMDALLNAKLKAAGDEFKPANYYLEKWGYKDRIKADGALPITR